MGFRALYNSFRHRRKIRDAGPGTRFNGKYLEVKGPVRFGARCVIKENVVLRAHKTGALQFGDEVEVCDNVLVQCDAPLQVGNGVYLGPFCIVRDTHHVLWGTDVNWRISPHYTQPIVIGDHAYIGAHCYIGPGITIGEGALIGPGSIVSKDVGPFEVWAGRPAQYIGNRRTGELDSRRRRQLDLVSMFGVVAPDSDAALATTEGEPRD